MKSREGRHVSFLNSIEVRTTSSFLIQYEDRRNSFPLLNWLYVAAIRNTGSG